MSGEILRNAVMITGFVFVMMLVIEYVNVLTSGRWGTGLARSRWGQYVLAALLGAVPGCLGSFAAVAMFSHGIFGLGALVAAMISTSGDETFVMLALIPRTAGVLIVALFAIGVLAGALTDAVAGRTRFLERLRCDCDGLRLHAGHEGEIFPRGDLASQWRRCTPARGILAAVLLLLALAVVTGMLGAHEHGAGLFPGGHHDGGGWGWIRLTLLVTSLMALFIVATVPDHFLEEHLWRHIAVRHVPRIFLWTLGALIVLHVITTRLQIDQATLAERGRWFMLAIACLVGLIPQSGPHLIFVTLFAAGYLPVSVLLANSIVQDGHGMLPMLAQSRRAFLLIKAIKLVFGLAVGAAAMAMGI